MKYALDKHEIETLKQAIDILDDIDCDEYANNIREILEGGGVKENTDYVRITTTDPAGAYKWQQTDEGYRDG